MKYKSIIYFAILLVTLSFVGCDNKKEAAGFNTNILEETTNLNSSILKKEKTTNSYQQFEVDVEKELLYGNDKGQIVNSVGEVVEEYSYLTIVNNGNISNGEMIIEGYMMSNSGKIINAFVRSGTANDVNEWTGVYKDTSSKGSGDEIIIVQDENTATYEFADTKEINCQIDGDNLNGTMWCFMKNSDGTLSVTSGTGGYWGRYERIKEEARIDVSDWNKVIDASKDNYIEVEEEYDGDENNNSLSDYQEVSILDIKRNQEAYVGTRIAVKGEVYANAMGKVFLIDEGVNTVSCDDIKMINMNGTEIGHPVNGDKCEVFGVLSEPDSFGEINIQSDVIIALD